MFSVPDAGLEEITVPPKCNRLYKVPDTCNRMGTVPDATLE